MQNSQKVSKKTKNYIYTDFQIRMDRKNTSHLPLNCLCCWSIANHSANLHVDSFHVLELIPFWIYQNWINAQATFRMGAVNLHHWVLQADQLIRVWNDKITDMVKNPASWFIQIIFRCSLLFVRSRQLEPGGSGIPPMDELGPTNPTTHAPVRSTQVKTKIQAVWTCREAEIKLPTHLKPPNLLKISNTMESEIAEGRNSANLHLPQIYERKIQLVPNKIQIISWKIWRVM